MENKNKKKLIVILGPTASGKSKLALEIAEKFDGEIVSADSRQIYRGMDIGTAKPPISPARRSRAAAKSSVQIFRRKEGTTTYISQGIPHHLIDIKNPNEDYSVGQYKKDAINAINKIIKAGKLPILVGGTGLYIAAIVKNLEIPAIKENKKLRKQLEKEIAHKGLAFVFDKLIALDPEAAYIIDPKNPRRVIRALEIAMISGKKFSEQRKIGEPLYKILEIGLNPPPEILKKRITARIKQMLNPPAGGGLVKEVKKLVKKYGYKRKAFDAIDYREIIDYLKKKISLEESVAQMDANTLRYAKRQMTWFKKYNPKTHWLDNKKSAEKLVKRFLNF